jgi:2-dehydro-3-deoxyphosphooctonate aldolase (KDO 8-P synthase)
MKLCGFDVGLDHPFFLIAGPCVIESEQMALDTAGALKEMTSALGIPFIYKSSFDKANRSSGKSFRGLGMEKGLEILATVKKQLHVPVLTDVHEVHEIKPVAAVVDVIQTPAFLCRQTDFIRACAQSGIPVNIKKGQFMTPADMRFSVAKVLKTRGCDEVTYEASQKHGVFLCERGSSFGYGNLVVDMRSLPIMRQYAPVIFDATHSVQMPGNGTGKTGGDSSMVPHLARAAAAVGVDGFFFETHFDPICALSDGPNMLRLEQLEELSEKLLQLDAIK